MIVRRIFVAVALLVVCIATACSIGPKQDDPLEDKGLDADVSLDSGAFTSPDSGVAGDDATPPPADTSAPSMDATLAPDVAADASDASDASDAGDASDAAETD